MSVLVVDHAHSAVCGIHDLGRRIADNLARACVDVTHADCGTAGDYLVAHHETRPDTVIINYRPDLMPWVVHILDGSEIAVLHNFDPATLDRQVRRVLSGGFARVLVLDHTMQPSDPRAIVAHRPIPDTVPHPEPAERPTVGSFGFAFPHKRFDTVAGECATLEGDTVFNLHMPEAYFNGASGAPIYTDGILSACHDAVGDAPVTIHHTDEHLPERELVARLAHNDVNALLYEPGQPDAGVSSALDYLIAARRPILVSEASMFHHVHDRVAVYPETGLADVFADYGTWQREADALYNDTAGRFAADLVNVL